MSKTKKKNKFAKKMDKRVEDRMKELYNDKDFRLQMESEVTDFKTPEDINKYQEQAAILSRKEAKNLPSPIEPEEEDEEPNRSLCCGAEYDEDIARCPDCKENC